MWISRDPGRRPAIFHMLVRDNAGRRWQNGECRIHGNPLLCGLSALQQRDPRGKVPPPSPTFTSGASAPWTSCSRRCIRFRKWKVILLNARNAASRGRTHCGRTDALPLLPSALIRAICFGFGASLFTVIASIVAADFFFAPGRRRAGPTARSSSTLPAAASCPRKPTSSTPPGARALANRWRRRVLALLPNERRSH
jgi:hypothetical protein